MIFERTDKLIDNSIEFGDLKQGDTFIFASSCNYHSEDPIIYMKCDGNIMHGYYNCVRLSDGFVSFVRRDLLVKRIDGAFVYSLEEGDD